MTTREGALQELLGRLWCAAFNVDRLQDGSLTVNTPFIFGDGDGYPVIIEHGRNGWRLTDRGIATARLQYAELDLTESRLNQIEAFANVNGYSYQDGVLSLTLEQPPEVEDVCALLTLIGQVAGMVHHLTPERDADQFRTRARDTVIDWLATPHSAVPNWSPPNRPRAELFKADLYLPARRPVVTFFAGSSQKADRSMSIVAQYRDWDLNVSPVLAHNGNLNSDTIYRAQMLLGDGEAVVRVDERAPRTGYLRLRRVLAATGVALSS